jgi:hypothetical protein
MARFAFPLFAAGALGLLILPAMAPADSPDTPDAAIINALALQKAMQEARYNLTHGNDSKKAVDLLEAELPNVKANAEYLRLLREAYRARIRDLYLANQPAQADLILGRLCVLEPGAATDPSLRPQPEAPKKIEAAPPKVVEPKQASIFPDFGKLFGKPAPAKARGVSDEVAPKEDPFDLKQQRDLPVSADKQGQARKLIAKADDEFKNKRYGPARTLYEQAYQLQSDSLTDRKEPWAYCVLNDAIEQLDRPMLAGPALVDLRQQVENAIAMAPNLNKSGQEILGAIDRRSKGPATTASTGTKHLGRNSEGWNVSETANFRIFHKQDDSFAEQVAQIAERTRSEMGRKWFGSEAPPWQPRCELIVYPSGVEYSQATGVPSASPGHSRIHSDETNAERVLTRWVHMRNDIPATLETVLPHETTHAVIAGKFGQFPVPRWADEGIAVLSEPPVKVAGHRQNLALCRQEGVLYGLKELMMLEKYPEDRMHITAFYAQSVALVELLTQQKGPVVFTTFVRDGLREGYEVALGKHYGMNFAQLQQLWNQQVLGGQKFAAGN